MENKSNSKTLQEKIINSGNTLKESLKRLTSIKDSNTNSIEDSNINSIEENQSSISSIIKSPSFKSMTELPTSSIKQVSETTSSFFNITSISLFLLVFIVLGIFGYIIYDYLVEGSKNINNLFNNVIDFFNQFTENNNKKNHKEFEKSNEKSNEKNNEKSKKLIKNVENEKTNNLKLLESNIKNKKSKSIVETENSKNLIETEENEQPEPIRTDSLTSGYCYIGKVNDTRYCTKVDARSKCMSGDIYPTMEICVNPNLRT